MKNNIVLLLLILLIILWNMWHVCVWWGVCNVYVCVCVCVWLFTVCPKYEVKITS